MKKRNNDRIAFETDGYSVVVCRHPNGKYLAVDESKNRGWWLPAGHVDRGQSFIEAAYRETMEEAGILVELKGVLAVEHTLMSDRACRMRVIFYAEPCDPLQPPKSIPDEESNGAAWLTLEEIEQKKGIRPPNVLRGEELLRWGRYIENGGMIAPILINEDGSYEGFFRIEDSGPSLKIIDRLKAVPLLGRNMTQDVNLPSGEKNWTPLHHAVAQCDVPRVRSLLLSGADPNSITHKGRTSLHFASVRGNLEIIRLLLLAGGNPLLVDFEGHTAEDVVADCSDKSLILHLMTLSR